MSAVAIVTGAAGGIGAAVARALAERGDVVYLNDLDATALAELAGRIPGKAHPLAGDVADPDAVAAMVAEVVEREGRLDTMVTCAALSGAAVLEDLLAVTPEQWRRVLAVDLDAVFYCAQAAARVMAPAGAGTIVNVASVSAIAAEPRAAAYCAAKAGVIGLTKAMAIDLAAAGVRVVAVAPGDIATATADAAIAARGGEPEPLAPLGRGTPEDVAALVAFASSAEARYLTGTTLIVDGGLLAG